MQTHTMAKIRFGFGLRAGEARITGADDLLAPLHADQSDEASGAGIVERITALRQFQKLKRDERDGKAQMRDVKTAQRKMRQSGLADAARIFNRPVRSEAGFLERLFFFWADHFTVSAKSQRLSFMLPAYLDEAIRPHVSGKFSDMLYAVITHPAMLIYLDQVASVGPRSRVGRRRNAGLNENLARELLELHTMGVGSGYDQTDVTELAELLTGLSVNADGFRFAPQMAEPGAETILGQRYGSAKRARLSDIRDALDDIALRPETATHLARKLVVHFLGTPDRDLIARTARAYQQSKGDLGAAYAAMLSHPSAWQAPLQKVKPPADFIISALRVLEFDGLDSLSVKEFRQGVFQPMIAMGQTPFRPQGPDGWSEEAADWITPATLAARIEWAAGAARKLAPDRDPRAFIDTALADAASKELRFAARAAESKWEGIALILASPEFNRR